MSRDPQRIPAILEKLDRVWQQYPDLRFCQMLAVVCVKNKKSHGNSPAMQDLFSLEDTALESYLDRVLEEGV